MFASKHGPILENAEKTHKIKKIVKRDLSSAENVRAQINLTGDVYNIDSFVVTKFHSGPDYPHQPQPSQHNSLQSSPTKKPMKRVRINEKGDSVVSISKNKEASNTRSSTKKTPSASRKSISATPIRDTTGKQSKIQYTPHPKKYIKSPTRSKNNNNNNGDSDRNNARDDDDFKIYDSIPKKYLDSLRKTPTKMERQSSDRFDALLSTPNSDRPSSISPFKSPTTKYGNIIRNGHKEEVNHSYIPPENTYHSIYDHHDDHKIPPEILSAIEIRKALQRQGKMNELETGKPPWYPPRSPERTYHTAMKEQLRHDRHQGEFRFEQFDI